MAKRDEEREKRLAEALRANLRRRKARVRAAAAEKEESEGLGKASHPGESRGP